MERWDEVSHIFGGTNSIVILHLCPEQLSGMGIYSPYSPHLFYSPYSPY